MSELPILNDIPAILARVRDWQTQPPDVWSDIVASEIVHKLAAEILSLRARVEHIEEYNQVLIDRVYVLGSENIQLALAKKRLDVLEELNEANRLSIDACGWIEDHETQEQFRTFAEVAERELSRREKENAQ